LAPSSSGSGHHSFKVKTWVRLPLGPDATLQIADSRLQIVGLSNLESPIWNLECDLRE
jgi:hypothetical protein